MYIRLAISVSIIHMNAQKNNDKTQCLISKNDTYIFSIGLKIFMR